MSQNPTDDTPIETTRALDVLAQPAGHPRPSPRVLRTKGPNTVGAGIGLVSLILAVIVMAAELGGIPRNSPVFAPALVLGGGTTIMVVTVIGFVVERVSRRATVREHERYGRDDYH